MLRQKLQRSYSIRDPAQQKFSCIVRLMTTRSVCLSVLVTLCLTSLLFTVSNFASESYSSHYTIGPRRFVHEAKKSHGPAVGNTVAAKSRVGAQEQMPRAVLNRKIDAVFKQLGAQGNGSVGALRAPVEKLFKNVEERRMQQNDIGTDLRNSTEDDVDESYDPMVMREESQEEEFVDPKRVSFLKSALRYTSTFKSRYHHYYNEDIKLLPPQTKGDFTCNGGSLHTEVINLKSFAAKAREVSNAGTCESTRMHQQKKDNMRTGGVYVGGG